MDPIHDSRFINRVIALCFDTKQLSKMKPSNANALVFNSAVVVKIKGMWCIVCTLYLTMKINLCILDVYIQRIFQNGEGDIYKRVKNFEFHMRKKIKNLFYRSKTTKSKR